MGMLIVSFKPASSITPVSYASPIPQPSGHFSLPIASQNKYYIRIFLFRNLWNFFFIFKQGHLTPRAPTVAPPLPEGREIEEKEEWTYVS